MANEIEELADFLSERCEIDVKDSYVQLSKDILKEIARYRKPAATDEELVEKWAEILAKTFNRIMPDDCEMCCNDSEEGCMHEDATDTPEQEICPQVKLVADSVALQLLPDIQVVREKEREKIAKEIFEELLPCFSANPDIDSAEVAVNIIYHKVMSLQSRFAKTYTTNCSKCGELLQTTHPPQVYPLGFLCLRCQKQALKEAE